MNWKFWRRPAKSRLTLEIHGNVVKAFCDWKVPKSAAERAENAELYAAMLLMVLSGRLSPALLQQAVAECGSRRGRDMSHAVLDFLGRELARPARVPPERPVVSPTEALQSPGAP